MQDVFVAFKAQICSEIADIVADMKARHIDNRHEGVRHANSVKKHLKIETLNLIEASYDDLIAFKKHLKARCEDGQEKASTQCDTDNS